MALGRMHGAEWDVNVDLLNVYLLNVYLKQRPATSIGTSKLQSGLCRVLKSGSSPIVELKNKSSFVFELEYSTILL